MEHKYFSLSDNFRTIIKSVLKDKKIDKMALIPTGWTNIVYEVETNEGNFFFRFPRDEFWSRTIVKDYEFAKFINKKTDFNTIKIELYYDGIRPFSMHKKIEGIPLAEKMNSLTQKQIDEISSEISKFMYQLHNINYSSSNIFTVNNIGLNLPSFLDELLSVHITPKNREFWNNTQTYNKNESCLVHGDLNPSNILLDENDHLAGIIDFGFGGFGNKYDDIARIIGRCPQGFKEAIVKSYELYEKSKLDSTLLNNNIDTWTKIDKAYIGYMKTIGIYE